MKLIFRGQAVAQGRPKFTTRGGFPRAYDPAKSRIWKDDVKMQALMQNVRIIEGPLFLKAEFHLMRPKSLPKKVTHHVKKPDLDNLVKAVKDALEGIAYNNDSQICREDIGKYYTIDDPRVIIEINHIEGEELL